MFNKKDQKRLKKIQKEIAKLKKEYQKMELSPCYSDSDLNLKSEKLLGIMDQILELEREKDRFILNSGTAGIGV